MDDVARTAAPPLAFGKLALAPRELGPGLIDGFDAMHRMVPQDLSP